MAIDVVTLALAKKYASSGSGSSVQSDWNQNDETAADYVKNRTHYDSRIIETKTYTFDGNMEGKETIQFEEGGFLVKLSNDAPTADEIVGGTMTVYENGGTFDEVITEEYINVTSESTYFIDPIGVVLEDTELNGLSLTKGIWTQCGLDGDAPVFYTSELSYSIVASGELHKLDNKYIDTIGAYGTGKGAEIFNEYEGEYKNIASGDYSHAEGSGTTASRYSSHAEGTGTTASGDHSHAEGGNTTASSDYSHAEGGNTTASGDYSHAEGSGTTASGNSSHAEGHGTTASGSSSHAEGSNTQATTGTSATVSTTGTTTAGYSAHAEGYGTVACGRCSHAEGNGTKASGQDSHAEGQRTTASGSHSHAEGYQTTASGHYGSHAEGGSTTASGSSSHAEGSATTASGDCSHAEGLYTTAQRAYQHAQGAYNILDTEGSKNTKGAYAHIVGNGTSLSARSNAHTLDWSGNAWYQGDVYVGSTSGTNKDDGSKKLATEEYVHNANLTNYYTKTEIDAIMGAYIVDIDTLIGGDG